MMKSLFTCDYDGHITCDYEVTFHMWHWWSHFLHVIMKSLFTSEKNDEVTFHLIMKSLFTHDYEVTFCLWLWKKHFSDVIMIESLFTCEYDEVTSHMWLWWSHSSYVIMVKSLFTNYNIQIYLWSIEKRALIKYAGNESLDQPVHLRSLIRASTACFQKH